MISLPTWPFHAGVDIVAMTNLRMVICLETTTTAHSLNA